MPAETDRFDAAQAAKIAEATDYLNDLIAEAHANGIRVEVSVRGSQTFSEQYERPQIAVSCFRYLKSASVGNARGRFGARDYRNPV